MSQEPFTIEYYSSLSTVYRRSLLIAIIHQNKNEERLRVYIIFLVLTPDHGHHIESYRSTDLQLLLHPQSLRRRQQKLILTLMKPQSNPLVKPTHITVAAPSIESPLTEPKTPAGNATY